MLSRNKISSSKNSFNPSAPLRTGSVQDKQISNILQEKRRIHLIKLLTVALLIGIALFERLLIDLGSNVELITLSIFLAAYYIGRRYSLIVALLALAISDILLGNTSIMLFTWSAYLLIAVFAGALSLFKKKGWQKILLATSGGIVGSIWFYLWTNFGVWLLDSWGMYADNFTGLVQSYINGLPFLRNHLVGNLIILSIGFSIVETTEYILHFFDFRKFYLTVQPLKLRNSVHPLR